MSGKKTRKSPKNKSFFVVAEGVITRRIAPPGIPERDAVRSEGDRMGKVEENFKMQDDVTCNVEE